MRQQIVPVPNGGTAKETSQSGSCESADAANPAWAAIELIDISANAIEILVINHLSYIQIL
jgi:hypothetical protein